MASFTKLKIPKMKLKGLKIRITCKDPLNDQFLPLSIHLYCPQDKARE